MEYQEPLYKILNVVKYIICFIVILAAVYYIMNFLNIDFNNKEIYLIWLITLMFFLYFLGTKRLTWTKILSLDNNLY